jgi:UDP-glucose 4-epimerase
MKALVTGSAGFIGSHLTNALIRRGWHVVGVDSLASGRREYVDPAAQFAQADVRDFRAMTELVNGVDVVFHYAAVASVPQASDDPYDAFDCNVQGTMSLAEAVRAKSPRATFVFASSAAVYRPQREPAARREEDVTSPRSVYGASKLSAEAGLLALRASYGLDTRILRYANVYGPRQLRYIMYDMYHKVSQSNGTVRVLGSGRQLRDFVFVDDAVAVSLAVAARAIETDSAPVFNVGTGISTSTLDVASYVAEAMGCPDIRFETTQSSWIGDVDYLLLDPSRTREYLASPTPVREGIRRFVGWMNEQAG